MQEHFEKVIGRLRTLEGLVERLQTVESLAGFKQEPALLHLPFWGAPPYETDFTIETDGHLGQTATVSGGVIGRPGKFGKAVQVAEATTNLIVNPIFENNVTDGWTFSQGGTGGSVSHDTNIYYIGNASCRYKAGTNTCYFRPSTNVALADGESITIGGYFRRDANFVGSFNIYDDTNNAARATTGGIPALIEPDNWEFLTLSWTNNTGSSVNVRPYFYNSSKDGVSNLWMDAIQFEKKAYPTPLAVGNMGTGHAWTGTAHNSTSSRTAAGLEYAGAGNYNPAQGTILGWVKRSEITSTRFAYLFRYDDGVDWNGVYSISTGTGQFRVRHNGVSTNMNAFWSTDDFIHVGWVWDGNTASLYFDGIFVDSVTGTTPLNPGGQLYVGWSGTSATQINGYIDDFAIFDKALTAQEVKTIYDSQLPLIVPRV